MNVTAVFATSVTGTVTSVPYVVAPGGRGHAARVGAAGGRRGHRDLAGGPVVDRAAPALSAAKWALRRLGVRGDAGQPS